MSDTTTPAEVPMPDPIYTADQLPAYMDAKAAAALAAAPQAPEGYVLVPVEPTREMRRCAEMWDDGFIGAWERALAATPGAPALQAQAQASDARDAASEERERTMIAMREWAVSRWRDEVENRPLVNVHRRTLDDTWRQVMRYAGLDPDEVVGPSHDAIKATEGENRG